MIPPGIPCPQSLLSRYPTPWVYPAPRIDTPRYATLWVYTIPWVPYPQTPRVFPAHTGYPTPLVYHTPRILYALRLCYTHPRKDMGPVT